MLKGDFSGLVNTDSGWLPASVVQQFQSLAPTAVAPLAIATSTTPTTWSTATSSRPVRFPPARLPFSPFPGNVIPSNLLDATALKSLPYYATAGPYFVDSNGNISNIAAPRLLTQNVKRYTVRIDQTISDKNRLYGRYTATPIVKIQGTPVSPHEQRRPL